MISHPAGCGAGRGAGRRARSGAGSERGTRRRRRRWQSSSGSRRAHPRPFPLRSGEAARAGARSPGAAAAAAGGADGCGGAAPFSEAAPGGAPPPLLPRRRGLRGGAGPWRRLHCLQLHPGPVDGGGGRLRRRGACRDGTPAAGAARVGEQSGGGGPADGRPVKAALGPRGGAAGRGAWPRGVYLLPSGGERPPRLRGRHGAGGAEVS